MLSKKYRCFGELKRRSHKRGIDFLTQRSLSRSHWGRIAQAAVLAVPVLLLPLRASAGILFNSTFENGIEPEWEPELCCSHSAKIVNSSTTPDGTKALKFTYKRTDATQESAKRSELRLNPDPQGSERWYAVSVYVPSTFETTEGGYIITQFHDKPDSGEPWKIPPLYIATDGQKLTLVNRWDTDSYTPERGGESKEWSLGSLTKGRWVNFVYHVKWSYKSDGLLEVFQDGKLVVKKSGPNTYNDKTGPYLKIGVYAAGISSEPEEYDFREQTIYFDRVRVGDADSSYKEIAANVDIPTPPSLPGGKTIRLEAEAMNLSAYQREAKKPASRDRVISLQEVPRGRGTASFSFPGSSGKYDVVVGYFDENDGKGRMSVKQDGQLLDWWYFDQNLGTGGVETRNLVRRTVRTGVPVQKGDIFLLTGVADQQEWARIDYIEFVPVSSLAAKP